MKRKKNKARSAVALRVMRAQQVARARAKLEKAEGRTTVRRRPATERSKPPRYKRRRMVPLKVAGRIVWFYPDEVKRKDVLG